MLERKAKGKPKPLRLSGFPPTHRPCRGQIHFKSKKCSKKNIKIVDKFAKLWYAVLEESK